MGGGNRDADSVPPSNSSSMAKGILSANCFQRARHADRTVPRACTLTSRPSSGPSADAYRFHPVCKAVHGIRSLYGLGTENENLPGSLR